MNEYHFSPSQANDVINSESAAEVAFQELSKDFAVIGHSWGRGTTGQTEAISPTPDYLGAIVISPYTNFLD